MSHEVLNLGWNGFGFNFPGWVGIGLKICPMKTSTGDHSRSSVHHTSALRSSTTKTAGQLQRRGFRVGLLVTLVPPQPASPHHVGRWAGRTDAGHVMLLSVSHWYQGSSHRPCHSISKPRRSPYR